MHPKNLYKRIFCGLLAVSALTSIFVFNRTAALADTVVANGDTTGLIAAINAANSNGSTPDTIILATNGIYTFTAAVGSGNALPVITTPITIVGNGATLIRDSSVATTTFRFFQVNNGGQLTLNNLSLQGGSSDLGGAINVKSGGILALNSVTAQNNQALGQNGSNFYYATTDSTYGSGGGAGLGGAVYVASNAQAFLTNSNLSGNCAIGGDGGKGDYGDHGGGGGAALGGGLYLEGTVYLTNTVVSNNEVIAGRGGLSGPIANLDSVVVIEPAVAYGCGQYVSKRSTSTGGRGGGANGGAPGGGGTAGNGGYASGGGAAVTGGKGGTPGGGGGASGEGGGPNAGIGGELGGSSYNPDFNNQRYGESRGGGIFNFKGTLYITGGAVNNNRTGRLSGTNPVTIDGEGMGGGISNYLARLNLDGTTVDNNFSGDGSGIWTSGPATASNLTLTNNQANYAGGFYVKYNSAALTLTNSTFSNNTAGNDGGAIYVTSGGGVPTGPTVKVSNSSFYSNTATGGTSFGGAISLDSSYQLIVTGTTFSNNSAKTRGGAINGFYDVQSLVTVTNSTFYSNTANNTAGAIGVDDGDMLSVTNSSFVSNTRAIFTGGTAPYALYNTLFVNNTTHCNHTTNLAANNLVFPSANSNANNCSATVGTVNPLAAQLPTANGGPTLTIPLLITATEAVDKGNPNFCPPTDQRGVSRLGICDIGAYEVNSLGSPTNLTLNQPTNSQAILSWTDNSSNETGFRIERKENAGNWYLLTIVAANVTTYTDSPITPTILFSYRVQAVAGNSVSGYSNEVQTSPLPAAPSNLQLSQPALFQAVLSWTDNSSNETGFRIERKENAGNWTTLADLGPNITSYSDNGITPSHVYTYRVYAFSAVGFSSPSNEVQNTPVAGYDFVVTVPTDNGTGAVNTLSWALQQAQSGQTIWFNLPGSGTLITISGNLPSPQPGVQIIGSCSQPITLNSSSAPQTWQLTGGRLYGLNLQKIKLFIVRPPNLFFCVKVNQ